MKLIWDEDRFVLLGDRNEARRMTKDTAFVSNGSTLFTRHDCCALDFWEFADDNARLRLAALKGELDASTATTWNGSRLALPADEEMHPYQSAGVSYCLNRRHAMIADEPGLGKTLQAIVIANETRAKRILIVCPASVRRQWADQIRRFGLGDTRSYIIEKASDGVSPLARWTIISYSLAAGTLVDVLRKGGWDYVVIDEAHNLKSPEAVRTRMLLGNSKITGIVAEVPRVVALTGTPMPNRPREIYTLAKSLDWGSIDYMSEDSFKRSFNYSQMAANGHSFERVIRLSELQNRLRCSFMVRRAKRAVLTQLPPVQYEMMHVDNTGAVRSAVKAERMLGLDPTTPGFGRDKIDGQVSTVRREMGIAKAPLVASIVNDMIDGGEGKIVLFGWHTAVLDTWMEKLAAHNPVRIDGSTSPAIRAGNIGRFRKDPTCRIIMGNLLAMGTGVDGLQEVCSLAMLGEMSWVPGDNEQAVDRLSRMGQQDAVRAIFLVAEGSIDEKIFLSAHGKAKNIRRALDNAQSAA